MRACNSCAPCHLSQMLSLLRCFPTCGRTSVVVNALSTDFTRLLVVHREVLWDQTTKRFPIISYVLYILPMVRGGVRSHRITAPGSVLRGPPCPAAPQLRVSGVTPPGTRRTALGGVATGELPPYRGGTAPQAAGEERGEGGVEGACASATARTASCSS